MRPILFLAALITISTVAPGFVLRAEDPPQALAKVPIDQWIRHLDANEFAVREAATANLIKAGGLAIQPVMNALEGASREVTFRAVYILRELALSSDTDVEEEARTALEKLAAMPDSVIGRRAESTLNGLNQIRQTRTVDELEKLGARFDVNRELGGLLLADSLSSVEIGPDWRGEEKDLRRLKWLANVQHITFVGPSVTDRWLVHLTGMTQITSVKVKRANVTVAGLEALKELPRLRFVELMYMPIGDGIVDNLVSLKTLQLVRLFGTQVTVEGANRLKTGLATAKIDYRRGGFLGVGANAISVIGCEVNRITKESAADRAGVQERDVIVRYDGQAVEGFERLTELIAVNQGGDTVTLEIARNVHLLQLRESHEKGAVLGISGKANALGCQLTEVADGSYGKRLELRAGDIVVRYKGERLYDPARFQTLFASCDPMEQQDLEIVRGAELLTLKATLGEWE